MASECPICLEHFNKSLHKEIKCGFCDYSACKTCTRKYLVSIHLEPHCMNCKNSWDQNFVIRNLNRNWYDNEYKKHREAQLLEVEMSKMPETMQAAENEKLRKKLMQVRYTLIIEYNKIVGQRTKDLYQLEEHYKHLKTETMHKLQEDYERAHRKITNRMQPELTRIQNLRRENDETIQEISRGGHAEGESKYLLPCPATDCRGYLSTSYKCELCELYTCSKCHEIIGRERINPEHVCDDDMVKSAEMIQKETKPCPKCGIRISKIDGCDQMWCTECQTAFSWRTGLVEIGRIHNPHFHQWQRENGIGGREPGDVPCGGLVEWRSILRKLRSLKLDFFTCEKHPYGDIVFPIASNAPPFIMTDEHVGNKHFTVSKPPPTPTLAEENNHDFLQKLQNMHSCIATVQETLLVRTQRNIRDYQTDNSSIRVMYLLNKINKEEMANQVYRKDNCRRMFVELAYIYELLGNIGIEIFRYIHDMLSNMRARRTNMHLICEINDKIRELDNLRVYCNKELEKIGISYNTKVYQITKEWKIVYRKFCMNPKKKKCVDAVSVADGACAADGTCAAAADGTCAAAADGTCAAADGTCAADGASA